MLRPESRSLVLENLRPPPGYRLDRAIGTTYTLDLISLLTAPLAFTFFDWEDRDGRPTADPIALLQAVREHAERIHLFCQAGEIHLPPVNQPLLAYLEGSVIPVRAPHGKGVFHPKVWILRYRGDADMPVCYRFLCMSRNLAFSRSWDTALVLEGELKDRQLAFARNHPLGDFVKALPGMALQAVEPGVRAALEIMESEVRRVQFELPEGFEDIRFWPLGHEAQPGWPFPEDGERRFLVMSPFLKPTFLRRLEQHHWIDHLISRPEELAALKPHVLKNVERCWAVSPAAELDAHEGADEPGDSGGVAAGEPRRAEAASLHAKLFVMDDGWDARVWTGSANATEAAFNRNVEFLVELVGKKKACGIEALLGSQERDDGLRPMLQPFDAASVEPEPEDEEGSKLLGLLEEARVAVASSDLAAEVLGEGGDRYSLMVDCARLASLPREVTGLIWPATLAEGAALQLVAREAALRFGALSLAAVTAFFAVDLRAKLGKRVDGVRFALRLPLRGAPDDRRERVLQSLLTDPQQVMRLLLLMLSGDGLRAQDFAKPGGSGSGGDFVFGRLGGDTLFEAMLRALTRRPEALDQVADLIRDLEKTEEGRKLLPPGLLAIWRPIEEARERLRSAAIAGR